MRRPSEWSLTSHLLFMVLLAVLPALLLVLATNLNRRRESLQASERSATGMALQVARQQEELAGDIRQNLSILAEASEVRERNGPGCDRLFRVLLEKNPSLLVLLAINPDGSILASSAPSKGVSLADRKYLQDALRTRRFSAGEYIMGRLTHKPVFTFGYPVLDASGKVLLILGSTIDLDSLDCSNALQGLPQGSSICILDHGGTVLYGTPGLGPSRGAPFPKERLGLEKAPPLGQVVRRRNDQGTSILSATVSSYLPGEASPYLITHVEIPEAQALAWARWELFRSLGLLLLAATSGLVVAWVVGRRFLISPIRALVADVERVGRGELGHRTGEVGSNTEVGRLAQAFDDMSTALKAHHGALRASEEHYRLVFNEAPMGIFHFDTQGVIQECNQAFAAILGTDRERLRRFPILEKVVHPGVLEAVTECLQGRIGRITGEYFSVIAGKRAICSLITYPITSEEGQPLGGIGLTEDITERFHAEEALKQSERYTRMILDSVNDAIFVHDLETGAILDVNAKMLEMYGCTREEALNGLVSDLSEGVPPYSHTEALAWIRKAASGGPQVFEWRGRKKSGDLFWVEVNMRRAQIGGVDRLLVTVRDIDARKAAESVSQERETLFRLLFERSGDANLLIDGNLFVDCNQVTVEILGAQDRASVLNTHPSELSPEFQPDGRSSREKADDMIATAFAKGSHRFEWIHRKLDGTEFPVEVMLTVIPWEGRKILHTAWRDRTEQKLAEAQRRTLETQFLQAQKLESLGVLAGGIAHDFNNLLTAVLGNLNLAEFNLSPASPAMPFLENAEKTVLKASDLTKQMLAYSGKGRFVVKLHDLNEVVKEMTHLLKVSISKKALLRLNLTEHLPTVEADGAQFQQVIMNLVTNASDALGDQEGVIRISTGAEDLDANDITSVFPGEPLSPGRYVTLEVSDTGDGMTPEVIHRIFDPFFTTKVSGRGLGLSAMLGILRGHKAGLKIYSEVGKGSTFKVYFPAAPGQAVRDEEVELPAPATFQGTVLLVDDEKTILEAMAAALDHLGFDVLLAVDGLEAVETFRSNLERIDLVIMDLTMPRMDGREAYQAMRRLKPGVKVILSSGYNELESIQPFLGKGLAGFLQKPYTLDSMKKMIHKILRPEG